MSNDFPTRRTLRLSAEVTYEVDDRDPEMTSDGLADEVRDPLFELMGYAVPGDVVAMTVSPAEEPPAPEVPGPAHEFVGTVKRADGIIVTATLTIPDTHPMAQPGPHRPWHGTAPRSNQNFLELGELAMMIAQRGYSLIESNERSRAHWGNRDYWADLLDIDPPTAAICGPGTAQQAASGTPIENTTEQEAHRG